MEKNLWKHILAVRQQSPLVHNITNYVVMNNTANALLAVGASPIMAHAKPEVRDLVELAQSLLINIGTLDEYWSESMLIAAEAAHSMGKPWVLDPVGAGATAYRDSVLQQLLHFKPTVVRGNASEIIALAKSNTASTKGVDSTVSSDEAIASATAILRQYDTVVCISGETDIIMDGRQTVRIDNGHPLMTKVTGLGCSASALIAAFTGAVTDKTEATVAAMALLGISGEMAAKRADGPGTMQAILLDSLYTITEDQFCTYLRIR